MKAILVHINDDDGLESRLQSAFDLARAFNGHVTCLHATPYEDYLREDPLVVAALPEEFSEKMRAKISELRQRIEARLRAEAISWDWVHFNELMSTSLIGYSVLSDVVVVSLGPPALEKSDPRPLAAKVAVGARTPVLGVPSGLDALRLDRPAVLAWNGSPEAATAMRNALPILKAVPQVHLLEIEEAMSAYPRDHAARYLSRYGVGVEIVQRGRIDGSISAAIGQAALELGAGIVVMGAYGHSRLRELVFGGVTRELTRSSAIPLLLAH